MTHLFGVSLPQRLNLRSALRKIYGLGDHHISQICVRTHFHPCTRMRQLSEHDLASISSEIEKQFLVEGELLKQNSRHLKRLIHIKSYRGLRHVSALPTRGQRTSSNAKTQRRIGKRRL